MMRIRLRWLFNSSLLFACVLGALAQETPPPPPAPPACPEKCPFTLSGTAINAATNAPLPRVRISLEGPVRAVLLTDGDGRFEFAQLPAGMFGVSAHKPGFLSANASIAAPGAATFLSRVDRNVSGITLKLFPIASITGRITDEHGLPAAGVSVRAYRRTSDGTNPRWDVAGSGTADGRGQYRISPLPAGLYCLGTDARIDGENRHNDPQPVSGYAPVSYPCNRTSLEDGLPLATGQRIDANLQVRETPFYSVAGTVGTTETTAEAGVSLMSDSPFPNPIFVMAEKDGTFRSPAVPAGRYEISASVRTPSGGLYGRTVLTVRSDVTGVQLPLSPAVRIPVSITSDAADNSPNLPPGQVELHPRRLAWISLMPVDSPEHSSVRDNRTSDDFIDAVIPGSYRVIISTSERQYVASATYGSVNLLGREAIQVVPGSSEPIRILLRSDGATIAGTLKGQGQSGGLLLAVPDASTGGFPRYVPLMPNGQFTVSSLAPGSYLLGMARNPEYLPAIASGQREAELLHPRRITVQPNQQVAVDLDLGEGEGE